MRLPTLAQPVRLGAAGTVHRTTVLELAGGRVVLDLPEGEAVEGRATLSFASPGGGMLVPGLLRTQRHRLVFVYDDDPQARGQRRDAYRVPVRVPVTVTLPRRTAAHDATITHSAVTHDLSVRGALLDTSRRHAPGSRVILTVRLGDDAAALDGVVVRSERPSADSPGLLAVAFVDVDPCEDRRLSRFLYAEQRRRFAAH